MQQLFSPWRSHYISSFAAAPSAVGAAEGAAEGAAVGADHAEKCVLCDVYNDSDDEGNLIVYRGREAFVVMNKFPYNSGHLMVLPARHTADFQSLTRSEVMETMDLLQASERALRELSRPQGFNIGMNIGRSSGAGIDAHLHWHIVPRWNGDTNFMPVLADVKVVSEDMAEQWKRLREMFPGMV